MWLAMCSASLPTPGRNPTTWRRGRTGRRSTVPVGWRRSRGDATARCPRGPGGRSRRSRARTRCTRSRWPPQGHAGRPAGGARRPLRRPGDALDSGGGQVLGPGPDERRGVGHEPWAHLAADRGVHGQHAVANDPEQQGLDDKPCRRALDAERDMAGLPSCQPGRVPSGNLGDLGP
jgi:hypothetical protein